MKAKSKLLVACIAGLLLLLAAVFLSRCRDKTQPDNQPPIDV